MFNSDDPEVQQRLVEKMIELTKEAQIECEGATILFRSEEEDSNKIDVFIECIKWEI